MDVRAQISMVFHLDKCIGCHTCSIACKNVWTDRKGTEYMWWNNVETKPGTGYPTKWEDQNAYQGGWELKDGELRLKSTGRARIVPNIFHNPSMPSMDDYYEPWTYRYKDLFDAPEGDDQPTARPISKITGEPIDIEAGPNWDDDLGGSPIYAENDPNLDALSPEERQQLFAIERLVFFYFPRICNHCLNPSCVAACPSGALYKRGEDGIVLIDQKVCRAWRSCVAACPYKKTYFNWFTGKSEKCILCFPRLETGQAPACFHSCVGRIRYLGMLLYDADRIEEVAKLPDDEIIEGQRSMILDPFDPEVIAAARKSGLQDSVIESAQKSPVYQFVKEWKIALPPHLEYRTLPMLFYVPPLSPVMGRKANGTVESVSADLFHDVEDARVPLEYLGRLFGAGGTGKVTYAMRKQMAVRAWRRAVTVGDIDKELATRMLREADCTEEEAEAIYKLTALCTFDERFVIPPMHREEAIEMMKDPHEHRSEAGFGFLSGTAEGHVNLHEALANLLRYPDEGGRAAALEAASILPPPLKELVAPLTEALRTGPADDLEERYTSTFDLDPACSLEVGWHIHGEDYARGAFLVRMRSLLRDLEIPEEVGLPDHLVHALYALGRLGPADAAALSRGWVLPATEIMRKRFEGETHVYAGALEAVATFLRERHGEPEPVTGSVGPEPYAGACGGCALSPPAMEGRDA